MEYFLTRRRIYLLITFQTIIFLYSKRLAADPMWIWTQGCFHLKEEDSTNVFNMSYNLPHTCLQKCGPQTMVVALQGNLCRCEFKSKVLRVTSFCTSCEHNSMVMCGDSKDGDWSLYMKAKPQELTAHGIQTNASGCIVNKNGLYHVENCSKTGIRSLCKSAFRNGRTNCDSDAGKWSPLSCDNPYDNLVDRFAGNVQGCSKEYWIGLFAIDKQLSHSTLSSYPQWPPSSSFPVESNVLLASAESSVLLASAEPSVLLASVESSVLLASATDQVRDESVEVLFSSTYDTHAHTEALSTHMTLISSRKLRSIFPIKPKQFETSLVSISYLYSSFSEPLPLYVDPSVSFITEILLPVLSQSELYFSITSTDTVSNRIPFTAKSHISPTSAKSELSSNEYSSASISFTSVELSRSGSNRASPEISFLLSLLLSQRNEMDGISTTAVAASATMDGISTPAISVSTTMDGISTTALSASTKMDGISTPAISVSTTMDGISTTGLSASTTKDGISTPTISVSTTMDGISTTALSASTTMDGISTTAISVSTTMDVVSTTALSASTTVMVATQQISPTPSYNTQKYSSETDLLVAVYVLGAIAAISLASTGVVYVYMKRSQTNLMKIINRSKRRGYENSSFGSFNNIPTVENDYVLY